MGGAERPKTDKPGVIPAYLEPYRHAWAVGNGQEGPRPDRDLHDALWLAGPNPDQPRWAPRNLSDRDRTPVRVLDLLGHVERGRNEPRWQWWRPKGSEEYSHMYRATFFQRPLEPSDCGSDDEFSPDVDWEYEERWKCPRCVRLSSGDDSMAAVHEQTKRMERY